MQVALVVGDGNVQQEVLEAGHDEHAERLREPARPVAEGRDHGSLGRPDPDGDECLDGAADLCEVDVEQRSPDDAALAQAARAFESPVIASTRSPRSWPSCHEPRRL